MQCLGINKNGLPCKRKVNNEYCWQHSDQISLTEITERIDKTYSSKITVNNEAIIKKLRGPISLTEQIDTKYDKYIYIFGDEHRKEAKCNEVKIEDFINSFANSNISLFLEISDLDVFQVLSGNSYIIDVYNLFRNKNKIYGTDIKTQFAKISDFIDNIYNVFFHSTNKQIVQRNKFLVLYFIFEMYLSEIKFIFDIQKINKVLNNIKDKVLKEMIIKYYNYDTTYLNFEIEDFRRAMSSLYLQFQDTTTINISVQKDYQKIKSFYDKLLRSYDNIFDLYLVTSIFTSPNRNVIVYVGEAHAERLRNLLDLLNFTLIQKSDNAVDRNKLDYQCLDISKFKQPFFSN